MKSSFPATLYGQPQLQPHLCSPESDRPSGTNLSGCDKSSNDFELEPQDRRATTADAGNAHPDTPSSRSEHTTSAPYPHTSAGRYTGRVPTTLLAYSTDILRRYRRRHL